MTAARTRLLLLLLAAAGAAGRTTAPERARDAQQPEEAPSTRPDIRVLEIRSDVRYRFARTEVFSKIANPSNETQEVVFSAVLPEAAFISGLAITQDGVVSHALVQSREDARVTYQAAVDAGLSAAHAEESARDARLFTVALNVAARSKAAFNLTYEQLLTRERGRYRLRHMLDPGQVVENMLVEVRIRDSNPFSLVRAAALRAMDNEVDTGEEGSDEPLATVERPAEGEAIVRWQPDADAQRSLGDGTGAGLHGLLEIQYDVERTSGRSELVVGDGGYFVHFFAPPESELTPLPKHVVFVLDTSGSMFGIKIQQLKEAMTTILSELREADAFSLVLFSSGTRVWSPSGGLQDVPTVEDLPSDAVVSQSFATQAQTTINGTHANGGTYMWQALQVAFALVRAGRAEAPSRQPLLFFLTDGEPNGYRSTTEELEVAVKEASADPSSAAPFYCLGFGAGVNFPFLQRLSLRGRGFARRVYEAADAALQLRNLYASVSSPLLANVTFQYADGQVEDGSLTLSAFPVQMAGGELVVAGRLSPATQDAAPAPEAEPTPAAGAAEDSLQARVVGDAASQATMTSPAVACRLPPLSAPFMERLWAYLTVRQLLERGQGDDAAARARALELALRYSFVTPLTSLVAVAPAGAETRSSLRDVVPGTRVSSVGPAGLQGSPSPSMVAHRAILPRPMMPSVPSGLSGFSSPSDSFMDAQAHGHAFEFYDRPMAPNLDYHRGATTLRRVVPLRRVRWLNDGVGGNGTHIFIQNGTTQHAYLVAQTQDLDLAAPTPCQVVDSGSVLNGTCQHLSRCALRLYADNAHKYLRYFCSIGEYAGTCCTIPESQLRRDHRHAP